MFCVTICSRKDSNKREESQVLIGRRLIRHERRGTVHSIRAVVVPVEALLFSESIGKDGSIGELGEESFVQQEIEHKQAMRESVKGVRARRDRKGAGK